MKLLMLKNQNKVYVTQYKVQKALNIIETLLKWKTSSRFDIRFVFLNSQKT